MNLIKFNEGIEEREIISETITLPNKLKNHPIYEQRVFGLLEM